MHNEEKRLTKGQPQNKDITKYSGFLANYSKNSRKMAHGIVNKFLLHMNNCHIGIDDLNQDIINIYCDNIKNSGVSQGTYNLKISYIKQFLKHLGKEYKFKQIKVSKYSNVKIVSESGYRNIIVYLRNKLYEKSNKHIKYLRDYIVFKCLFLTGLRKIEVISMKYKDVILEGQFWVYNTIGKGNKPIKKKFPKSLVSPLLKLKALENKTDNDYIFTSIYTKKGDPLSHYALNKILNKYYKIANIDAQHVTVHGIRNLSALKTYLITGKDIEKTKHHLNHSHLNTTDQYISKVMDIDIDYYEKLEQTIEGELEQSIEGFI